MKRNVILIVFILLFKMASSQSSSLFIQELQPSGTVDNVAKTSSCPPLFVPLLGYATQTSFGSGVNAEFNLYFPYGKCTDCSGFGVLCYFIGWNTGISTKYFPSPKIFDLSANLGYRDARIVPFGKFQLGGGYSISHNPAINNFFHLDPSIGFDLFVLNLAVGYSFRSEKVQNKKGAMTFQISLSPLVLFKSKSRNLISRFTATSKSNRKQFLQGL